METEPYRSAPRFQPKFSSAGAGRISNSSVGYGPLLIALLVFLVQILPYLGNRWTTDESWYAAPAYSVSQGHGLKDIALAPNDLERLLDVRPPMTALVTALSFKLFGVSVVTGRLGSVLAGVGVVCLVFFLLRDLFDEQALLLALLLLATDNLTFITSRSNRPEPETAFFALLALLAMKLYASRGGWWLALLSGLLIGAGTMSHITIGGYIAAIALLAMWIDLSAGRMMLRGLLLYLLGFAVALTPFVLWILHEPLGREAFHQEFLARATSSSIATRLILEGRRYRDVFGIGLVHGHGLSSLPLRAPIPLLFVAALVVLWKYRRSWLCLQLLLWALPAAWLVYTVNKSSRYLALTSPVIAITIAAAVFVTRDDRRVHRFLVIAAMVVVLAQFSTNLVLLRGARQANYAQVTGELRKIIPADQTAYGTITLWLGFHDRKYISYERTDPWVAAQEYGARYFIVGDPVLEHGYGGDDEFKYLRAMLADVRAQSDVVGEVDNPYYGDLTVLRLRPGARPSATSGQSPTH